MISIASPDTHDFDEIFVNNSIILSADLPFRIARAQTLLAGVALNLSFDGNPESPRRNNYSLYGNYDLALSRSFSLDAAFQFVVRDYYSGDRTDVNEILSLRRKLPGSRLAHIERSQLFLLESVQSQCLRLQCRQHWRRRSAGTEILRSGEQTISFFSAKSENLSARFARLSHRDCHLFRRRAAERSACYTRSKRC
jgi:hypothetical protein